jgi:hypothetical protein
MTTLNKMKDVVSKYKFHISGVTLLVCVVIGISIYFYMSKNTKVSSTVPTEKSSEKSSEVCEDCNLSPTEIYPNDSNYEDEFALDDDSVPLHKNFFEM